MFIGNILLFIDDLAFFNLKRYVLWSIVEVSEPSVFEENKNNRCLVTCPGLQPLEHKFDSPACNEYNAYAEYLTSFFT